ncbi:MAG: hypothetical protein V2A58_01215 [Planctomycetota bacterium]
MFEGSPAQPSFLPPRLQVLVRDELADNEHVLWLAQPDPKRFVRNLGCLVAFGLVWTAAVVGGSLFWIVILILARASQSDVPAFFYLGPLAALPFALLGFAILLVPRWVRRKAAQTAYVITDRRALLIEAGRLVKVRSFPPRALLSIDVRRYPDGFGDIVFDRAPGQEQSPYQGAFIAVPDVAGVEKLLREVAHANRSIETPSSL